MNATPLLLPSRAEMERAFQAKDPSFDSVFYVAVRTTGIFCRPSCPSRPHLDNVEFFGTPRDCLEAGYRPCLRCHPMEAGGRPPSWVTALMARAEAAGDRPLRAEEMRATGASPERARRWFQQHYGMTFAAWCRGRRLAGARVQLRDGEAIDDVAFDSGYGSHSGFREAFVKAFGQAPGRSRAGGDWMATAMIDSPLGPLLAGATDAGLCLLGFADRHSLEVVLPALTRQLGLPAVPGDHRFLERLRRELTEYFAGRRRDFTVPLRPRGTPFQERVWEELRRLDFGETISYEQLAQRIGQPSAQRAVALANARNRLAIVIPCHRVVGKDGSLTGYGGGLWRKRLLLELERGRVLTVAAGPPSRSVSRAAEPREGR